MKNFFVFFIAIFIFSFSYSYGQSCKDCSPNFKPFAQNLLTIHSKCGEPTPEIFLERRDLYVSNVRTLRDLIFLYVNCPGSEAATSIVPVFRKNLQHLMNCCSNESELNYLKFLIPKELQKEVEKEIEKKHYRSYSILDLPENEEMTRIHFLTIY